jgi:putative transposase
MAKKWTNRNLPGALHYVTGNVNKRIPIFRNETACKVFLEECQSLRTKRESKLISFVVMPDHFHLIVNPRDGNIQQWTGLLKSNSALRLVNISPTAFLRDKPDEDGSIHQVWQESFKDFPLWSSWMIWQKINYIHANPLRAKLVRETKDYRWSSFHAFYLKETDPLLQVDKDWWWEDDARKLSTAMTEWEKELEAKRRKK